MKVHLSADYQSETWFYPVYSLAGQLTAVELVTQFVHDSAPITLPQDLLLPQLDDAQQLRLLQSQLSLLEKYRDFFEINQITALVRIDDSMANTLLASEFLLRKFRQIPFIVLDISETFPQLSLGKSHPLLAALQSEFRLSLSQFGAGKAPATAVYDNLFSVLKLDKAFIHNLAKRASFTPFIQTVINNFSDFADQIIICGIDDNQMMEKMTTLSGAQLQGSLFPVVKAERLNDLIYSDLNLHTPSQQ
ncbi:MULTISPECIES: EAL domain-containing protein [unclassified Pantoea]|uniref:EAL domain-containing protein n=1 Tax=unclassified Pantoea TaxID=2630326 RepID=UPI0024536E77|nr:MULTISPECIES: EAL domain-containing protein [unclassified Pantoea]MDR6350666.1 EAL domain-containing protein (putative c-di-GMP-specific phosphodiesterase class I) [Pantoea sp. SORGH_AS_0659]WGK58829.1 EAL domain-containing protein [Pantoea sp. SS70]